jgi:hypothetical protein
MDKGYGKNSSNTLVRANEFSERAIFWGMIATVLVVFAGMIKGLLG